MESVMSKLPPLADAEEIEHVRRICAAGGANISGRNNRQTQRYLTEIWRVPLMRLGESVAEHIELKRKIFAKLDENGRRIAGKMHANVTLAEELDVYVEIELRGDEVVILAAHGHYTANKLPQ
jgi:hypothetical protein